VKREKQTAARTTNESLDDESGTTRMTSESLGEVAAAAGWFLKP
jgi:hypothetical protein